jgi:ABC-type transporter Mla MlaB component
MGNDLKQKTQHLISILEQIEQLLVAHGEQHWSAWIKRDLTAIKRYDAHGIAHLLSAYGGMGSFNDLWLCAVNGHRIGESEVIEVNDKLSALRSEAYTLAKDIKPKIQ